MVTSQGHLRDVGTAPSASPRAGPDLEGFSAGQLASATPIHRKISLLRPAPLTRTHPVTRASRGAGQYWVPDLHRAMARTRFVQVLLALGEVDVAGVDDQQRRLAQRWKKSL